MTAPALNYIQAAAVKLADLLPGCDSELLRLYALLVFTRGTETTLEDVHDAWSVWRNTTGPEHRSLVPFDQLAPEVQELDRKYMQAIHLVASAADRVAQVVDHGPTKPPYGSPERAAWDAEAGDG